MSIDVLRLLDDIESPSYKDFISLNEFEIQISNFKNCIINEPRYIWSKKRLLKLIDEYFRTYGKTK